MYKIIGADQREYGPVPSEQIRQWIAEGRANGATLVQPEGATDWVPLSSIPEFADALSAQAPPTPPAQAAVAPFESATDPNALASEVRARDYHLDIGQCLIRSWELFKANFGLLIGAALILLIIVIGFNQLIALFTRGAIEDLMAGGISPGPILVILLWNIPEVALSTLLTAGYYLILLKLARGQPAGLGDLFAGFGPRFVQLALTGIVVQYLTMIGFLACIIPGVYLSVAWILAVPLVIDRGFDFWSAMELSRKVVTQHWWLVFCLILVFAAIGIVGFLACCVGLLVSIPVGLGAIIYAYEDIFRPGITAS